VLINPIIRSRTRYFRHVYPPTCDSIIPLLNTLESSRSHIRIAFTPVYFTARNTGLPKKLYGIPTADLRPLDNRPCVDTLFANIDLCEFRKRQTPTPARFLLSGCGQITLSVRHLSRICREFSHINGVSLIILVSLVVSD
jgi:hypothetical protein